MKPKNRSWVVKIRHTVIKELVLEGCTEKQAKESPFGHSVQEREVDSEDWEVISVEPNE